jgi:hypothetical protein
VYGIRNLVKKYTTVDNRKELLEIFYVNAQNPLAKKTSLSFTKSLSKENKFNPKNNEKKRNLV